MRAVLKYLFLCMWCLFLTGHRPVGDSQESDSTKTRVQEKMIRNFRSSLGFTYLSGDDRLPDHADSLLRVLEEREQYDSYFELARILIKSRVLRGETRIAIAESDRMYSKASALKYPFGQALALNAIGEVYALTGRNKEAGDAYRKALELFDSLEQDEGLIKILLVELSEYYLRMGKADKAATYIARLNKYPLEGQSESEIAVRYIFNANYKFATGALDETRAYLEKARKFLPEVPVGIQLHFFLAEAAYLEKVGKTDEALKVYDRFFHMKEAKNNSGLYVVAMKNKADLLVNSGRKEEAFRQLASVYAYIKSAFEKNYPKEIDQLTSRFQADQLTYQNERDRHLSFRYYTIGITLCVLLLLLFSFLSWKKIFRLKQSKANLEQMKCKAENAIKRKNLFLSNMSHEVRTPLNAIVGFSGLLASGETEEEEEAQREYCEIIKVNSYQLLKLINDIIDFSDFEEDHIRFNIGKHDAVAICKEVIETMLASYRIGVDMRLETDLSSLVLETDDSRLRQVLINLLVNAMKFTQEGSIVLKLEVSGEDKPMALFSVTDTGCGIPLEKQKLIFERFEKLNDRVQGSGLGLSICQLIVKHVKGRLWIDPDYTEGARFYFTHPIKCESPLH